MEAPEKIYLQEPTKVRTQKTYDNDVEYIRSDAFVEKAKKWFEMQNEGVDEAGKYKCDMTDFEDFIKFISE